MSYIFVVEDEFDIQELLKNYLEEAGYQGFAPLMGWKLLICTRRKKRKLIWFFWT